MACAGIGCLRWDVGRTGQAFPDPGSMDRAGMIRLWRSRLFLLLIPDGGCYISFVIREFFVLI
jgi:hypothetical protein